MNKKAIGLIWLLIPLMIGLLIFYVILYLPIPSFQKLRIVINYFLIIIFWVLLQVLIIFGYFEIGKFTIKGFKFIQYKFTNWTIGVKNYIIFKTQ